MTEKELRKLHRQDLLELLVEQSREASRLNTALNEKEQECRETTEGNERLKAKLDEKDVQLEKLKSRLDEKDAEQAQQAAAGEEQLEGLKAKLDEKDALIEKLKGRLDEKDALLEKLKGRLDEKDAALSGQSTDREAGLKRLKDRLDEKDALIGKLREQLERREMKIEKLEAETERLRQNKWKEMKESGLPAELLNRLKALL